MTSRLKTGAAIVVAALAVGGYAGTISLAAAQQSIATDWQHAR